MNALLYRLRNTLFPKAGLKVNFIDLIVDLHAIARNNTEKSQVPFTHFSPMIVSSMYGKKTPQYYKVISLHLI